MILYDYYAGLSNGIDLRSCCGERDATPVGCRLIHAKRGVPVICTLQTTINYHSYEATTRRNWNMNWNEWD